jgi:hypothetical protein
MIFVLLIMCIIVLGVLKRPLLAARSMKQNFMMIPMTMRKVKKVKKTWNYFMQQSYKIILFQGSTLDSDGEKGCDWHGE